MSTMNGNYNFISNNVKGIKASEKRLKMFEYLKNSINDNGTLTLTRAVYFVALWAKFLNFKEKNLRNPMYAHL